MISGSFIHLHLRSEYSILDSIVQIDELCQNLIDQKVPAVAITDISNLFGMVKFYKAAMARGIKPIIGVELWVESQSGEQFDKLVLLCQNNEGYKNLTKLVSQSYQIGERVEAPIAKRAWVREYSQGLIALSGAQYGEIGKALLNDSAHNAQALLNEWMSIFPNRFYLELQRNGREKEKSYEIKVLELARKSSCPIVATNEVVFLKPADFEAHKTRVCIQRGITLEQFANDGYYSEEQYLKTPEEMQKLFHDIPQAIQNSLEIAKRCTLSLTLDKPVLPSFPVPENLTEESYIKKASIEGLEKRLVEIFNKYPLPDEEKAKKRQAYFERLEQELAVINSMGFPGYFLIVADFIQWAKSNLIPVGPGRGSGAGSLVAYALSITDLDPIEYDLLFERFLNPERVSMPDFDIDFCMDNRDKVIEYVTKRYGRHNVSQIATFGTMAAKAVIRDVGRALGHPYGFVDKIAKLIPFEIGITLDKALAQEVTLQKRYEEEEDVRLLIDLSKKLEGITRNVGKHAGGVVIAPSSLTDFAPLYCEKESDQVVVQFDKDDVEAIGLIKFDFLGLRTLTIIDWAVQNANRILEKKNLPKIDIQQIPLNDKKTFDLLKSCATTAIFQLESRGMKELIKRLQPDKFEEIIALVALFRPGPLQSGMVDDFINRKHGRCKVEYSHPVMEPILKPTYGVILYQEQVMQIAQTLSGYTLGGADLLRRAMGKKKPEEMAMQRDTFIKGAMANDADEKTASYIFDLVEKFSGYGFNKSHSAAYALVSYQTAWLKAHYPSAFMAAVLSSDMAHTDKVVNFIEECHQCRIPVIPPCINQSDYFFTVNDKDEIIYGLGAIKGVGEAAIDDILAQRKKKPFTSLHDFCERIDHRKVNKRVLESLIKSGCFDCFGMERSQLSHLLDHAMKQAEQLSKNISLGQNDLFQDLTHQQESPPIDNIKSWTTQERLQAEKESLGMYFSGHPLEIVEEELKSLGVEKFQDIKITKKERKALLAGLIVSFKTLQTKNGDRMAVVMLDDRYKRYEITLYPDTYQNFREVLIKDSLLIFQCTLTNDTFSGGIKVRAQTLMTLSQAREMFVRKIKISLKQEKILPQFVEVLKECLLEHELGDCPIFIEYQLSQAKALIRLGAKWNIKPSEKLIEQINSLAQGEVALMEYS